MYLLVVILSDRDICKELDGEFRTAQKLSIDPIILGSLQPASYEVHLDYRDGTDGICLYPGQFRLAHTVEKVTIPSHLCAQVNGKSSLGRLGLLVHATAGFIDPGFEGQITLELKNLSNRDIHLTAGDPVAQLVFHRLTSPAHRPYGHPELGSHYQGQMGTTRSYMDA